MIDFNKINRVKIYNNIIYPFYTYHIVQLWNDKYKENNYISSYDIYRNRNKWFDIELSI